ncbi:MAG: hypothetical protein KAS30_03375, partial [Candidatus Diapherotrites archaeon]|nr:hypothetical protein [Candidatus Diapherotrites archaeon]
MSFQKKLLLVFACIVVVLVLFQPVYSLVNPAYVINGEELSKRKLITIDGSKVTTESNIPLMLRTTLPGVKTGGADVRLAQLDGTPIAREIEWHYTESDDVVLHYPFDTIAGEDSQFYNYWGNPDLNEPVADSTYGSEAVWGSNYAGVWLMNNNPAESMPQLLDSTLNNNNGTAQGMMVHEDLIDGKYGKGINFDGNDDNFNVGSGSSIDLSNQDFSIIMQYKTLGTDYYIPLSKTISPWGNGQELMMGDGNTGVHFNFFGDASTYNISRTSDYKTISRTFKANTKNKIIYYNGILGNSATSIYVLNNNDGANMTIGCSYQRNDECLYGQISFISIYKGVLSSNYILTNHNNLNNPTTIGTDAFYFDRADNTEKYSAKSDSIGTVSEFLRRQSLTITTTGSTIPANYQVKVTVPHKLAMNMNFSDLRFNTSTDGTGI